MANKKTKVHTIKLEGDLEARIERAQRAEGVKTFSQWARGAFLERCRSVETRMRNELPDEFEKIYGKGAR